ncbi:MAG: hypothetical protein ACRCYE_13940, partial [Sarcina sp.]
MKNKESLISKSILKRAIKDSILKLNPKVQIGNPVMFIVYIASIITTILSNSMLSELITQMDIIDSERNIDIEKLYQVSKYAISKSQNITIGN